MKTADGALTPTEQVLVKQLVAAVVKELKTNITEVTQPKSAA